MGTSTSLRQEIMFTFLLVTLPVLVGLGAFLTLSGTRTMEQLVEAETRSTINFVTYTVTAFQEDALAHLKAIDTMTGAEGKGLALVESGFPHLFPHVRSLLFADREGTIVATFPESRDIVGNDVSQQSYFVRGQDGPYWSEAFTDLAMGTSSVTLSGPAGPYVCVLYLDLSPLQDSLAEIQLRQGGRLSITDQYGILLADQNPRAVERRDRTIWPLRPTGTSPVHTRDSEGRETMLWVTSLGTTGWLMFQTMDYWLVWTPLAQFAGLVGLLLVSATGLVTVLLWFRVRKITSHLEAFAGAAVKIGQGQYHSITVPAHPREFESLGRTINGMVQSIAEREGAIHDLNRSLEERVQARTAELNERNNELESALDALRRTQEQLARSEQLATLGHLVAGVAHEINTPLGVAITAASFFSVATGEIRSAVRQGTMTQAQFDKSMERLEETVDLVNRNLDRAAQLVRNFKQLAIDQNQDQERDLDLGQHLGNVVDSLRPAWKHRPIELSLNVPQGLVARTYPGCLAQILTNLIMNSLDHGFGPADSGSITIKCGLYGDTVELDYRDTGKGMDSLAAQRIYDPFFTTKRDAGNTGLGMNIVHNLVKTTLEGTIDLDTAPGKGARFIIRFKQKRPAAVV